MQLYYGCQLSGVEVQSNVCMCSLRRSSGPYRSGGGAAVPQTFERSHVSLTSGGDGQSSGGQPPPPRFTRRVDPVIAEPQRVTVAAAPTLTQQPIAVVPAAVIQTPAAAAQVALAEPTNPPPARYTCSSCRWDKVDVTCSCDNSEQS